MALNRAKVTTANETTEAKANAAPEQAAEVVKETVAEQVLETREEQAQAEADQAAAAGAQVEDGAQQDVVHEQEAQAAAEPEVQTEQVATEAQADVVAEQVQAKEVAVAQGGAVAVAGAGAARGAMASFTSDMAELGFEGLTVDGMSFDRIKLTEGKFVLGSEEISLGESFDMVLKGTRPIYIVRQRNDDDAEIFFSYDPNGDFLTTGESSAEIKEKWLEDGYGTADEPLDIKRYLEGMAELVNRDDEWNGHMVSLSIPPASTSRLGGALITGKQRFKRDPDGLVVTCKVGQKIQKGSISWRPWVFIAKGEYNA